MPFLLYTYLQGASCGYGIKHRKVDCYRDQTLVSPAHCLQLHTTFAAGESENLIETDINSSDRYRLDLETEQLCYVSCGRDCLLSDWSPWSVCHRPCNFTETIDVNGKGSFTVY